MKPLLNLPAIPVVRLDRTCFWEPISSTIDWCEKNCEYSYFIAEFFNSISNLGIMLPPLLGLYMCRNNRLEPRFWLMFLSQVFVGWGSFLFHATLSHWGQFLDEGPMIIEGLVFFYTVVETGSRQKYPFLPFLLFLYTIVIYFIIYFQFHPIFFQSTYSALLLFVGYRALCMLKEVQNPKNKQLAHRSIFAWSLAMLCWLIDYHACHWIERFPFRNFFQLHAWWHILTGIGSYYAAIFFCSHRLIRSRESPHLHYLFHFLPYLTYSPRPKLESNFSSKI